MKPIRHSSAHQCHPDKVVQAKGSAIVAIRVPTQPV
jgi:hypothetical protein